MIALYTVCAVFALTVTITTIGNIIVQRNLTRSIDTLSNKIMARDYRDYKGAESIKEDDSSPVRDDDEPKGWFDH